MPENRPVRQTSVLRAFCRERRYRVARGTVQSTIWCKAALARITGANGIATTTARDRLAYNTVAREIFHA